MEKFNLDTWTTTLEHKMPYLDLGAIYSIEGVLSLGRTEGFNKACDLIAAEFEAWTFTSGLGRGYDHPLGLALEKLKATIESLKGK